MLHVYFYISGLILGIVIFFIVRHVHTHFHKKTPIISQLDDEELDEIENLVDMREFGGIVKVSVNLATDTNNGHKVLVLDRTDKNIKGSAAIFVAGGRSVDSKVAKANKIVLSNNKSSKGMK